MNIWEIVWKCELTFELLLFSFLMCRNFARKPLFWIRAAAGSGICLFGTLLFVILLQFLPIKDVSNTKTMWESIPGIIIMFLLSMLTMVFCYENSVREIFFVSVAAYSTQIILYSVFILLQTFLNINDGIAFILLYVVLLAVAVYMVLHFMEKRIDETEHVTVHPGFLLLLLVTAGLIDTVFKFYMVDHMLGVETKEIFAAWKIFSMVACLLLLMVQFGTLKRNSISAQKQQLEDLLYQKQQQYELSRKNMELINIKCHDLKHWFKRLQSLSGSAYEKEAKEIQKALAIYDSMFQTGNKILDTILTEKKLYCEYNKINMTCIAEGEKLDFLSESELCSLFGNIVDNAVTAVSHLEEEEKRTINILVRTRGNFLSIHEENYYEGELKKSGDGFETTKKDKEHHGFGLKSIKMITENHHGNMSVTAEDGVFNINILIPLPSMEK